jgi:hypothetical protein
LRRGGTLATLLVLIIAASGYSPAPAARAHEPHPGLDFSLEVAGAAGCNTIQPDVNCALTPGQAFTVNVNLGPLPGDIPNYGGFDIDITYQGVASHGVPSTAAWPDCGYPALSDYTPPGEFLFACAIGVAPAGPSTYSGTIATLQFACTQAGTIILHNGYGQTDLVGDQFVEHSDPTPTETLNITCGTALARFADANCDGLVNSVDVLLILQFSAHLLDHLPCQEAADANGDGVVNAVDAALVLQAVAGLLGMPTPPPTPTPCTATAPCTPTATRCLLVGPGATSTCCPGPCFVTPTPTLGNRRANLLS